MVRFSSAFIIMFLVARLLSAANAPIAPADAPAHMTLPPGFRATLFAGEPDVVQPIAFTFDDRGRLWVAECMSYPNWQTDLSKPGVDRILIFEDDGAGHFSRRKVFLDHIVNLSGLEVGFGGVYVLSLPNLMYIPVGADDKPGKPQVLLDGWASVEAKHNVANRLTWGPDGWLWGCHGILATSNVGKPGAPDSERTKLNCSVWRFQPTTRKFDVVASGTTNPWGLDFDDYGQAFITNCVIKHLWHVIPGAHYQRMYGEDLDKYGYGLMESCADHIHWAGGDWTTSRNGTGANAEAGGGHAHAGCMVYLGDNWPDSYRNNVFMCNIHGNRVNDDVLEHKGSGYVAHHGHDFLMANDPWFRGLNCAYGPDGGVYVSDWCDTGECHNYGAVDRTNGRLYKVTYGSPAHVTVELSKADDSELIALQSHKNDWWVRHARRILQERAVAGTLKDSTRPALVKMLNENPDSTRQLRAMWALHATGGIGEQLTQALLARPQEYVRAWAVRLALDDHDADDALRSRFVEMAKSDPSPVVRLALASGLQRMSLSHRWEIAEALAAHDADAMDQNLPLMEWYAIEPLVAADPVRAADLVTKTRIPLLRQYISRRLVGIGEP